MRSTLIKGVATLGIVAAGLCGLAVAAAHADEQPPVAMRRRAAVGIRAGLVLPQVATELGTTVGIELDAAYRVWRRLSPYVGVGYRQPAVDHDGTDPRLAGAFNTSTTQRELTFTAGARWHLRPPTANFNAYGALGLRAYLLETLTNGDAAGQSFLENRETSTRYGGVFAVGGEFRLGPGAAVAELEVGGSDLPHVITGDVSTTAVGLSVGFRMFF